MKFEQAMTFRCDDPDGLLRLLYEWDEAQATTDVMGYIGTRLLANRDDPGRYMILAEFAEVDGDLTPARGGRAEQPTRGDAAMGRQAAGFDRRRAGVGALRRAVPHGYHW